MKAVNVRNIKLEKQRLRNVQNPSKSNRVLNNKKGKLNKEYRKHIESEKAI